MGLSNLFARGLLALALLTAIAGCASTGVNLGFSLPIGRSAGVGVSVGAGMGVSLGMAVGASVAFGPQALSSKVRKRISRENFARTGVAPI